MLSDSNGEQQRKKCFYKNQARSASALCKTLITNYHQREGGAHTPGGGLCVGKECENGCVHVLPAATNNLILHRHQRSLLLFFACSRTEEWLVTPPTPIPTALRPPSADFHQHRARAVF